MKKRYLIGLPLAALALALLVWLSGLAAARLAPSAVACPETAALSGPAAIQPGDAVTATAKVTVPAGTEIEDTAVSGPGVLPLTGDAKKSRWLWNRRSVRLTARFRVLKSGELTDLKLGFRCRIPGTVRSETRSIPLPKLVSHLDPKLAPDAELLLAGAVTAPEAPASRWRRYLFPAALLVAAVLLFLWWRSRRRNRKTAVWDRALAAVAALRSALDAGKLTPERGFARLCDVVRDYLEVRLGLPASRRTTPEFLRELRRDMPELPEDRREFLHRFLAAADLVKFAKARSDRAAFDAAADRAEELIRATGAKEEKR